MKETVGAVESRLNSLARELKGFRARNGRRAHPPSWMWQAAVGLCNEVQRPVVARRLRVSEQSLRNKMAKAQKQAAPQFMELSLPHASANATPGAASERLELKIELERPDGIKLRLQSVGSQETLLLDVVKRFIGEVT